MVLHMRRLGRSQLIHSYHHLDRTSQIIRRYRRPNQYHCLDRLRLCQYQDHWGRHLGNGFRLCCGTTHRYRNHNPNPYR